MNSTECYSSQNVIVHNHRFVAHLLFHNEMGCKSVISSETLLIQPYYLALTIQELCTLYGEDLELLELL